MKNKKIYLSSIFFFMLLISSCFAFPFTPNSEISNDNDNIAQPFETNLYRVGETDVLFCFYGVYVDDGYYLSTSTDNGLNWTEQGSISGFLNQIYDLDYTTFHDGTYFYYMICESFSDSFHFRKGILNANETITWVAGAQEIDLIASSLHFNEMVVDSNGNAYGTYYDSNSADHVELIKNANTDGTWSTSGGYPKTVLTSSTRPSLRIDSNNTIYWMFVDSVSSALDLYSVQSDVVTFEVEIAPAIAVLESFSSTIDQNNNLLIVYNYNSDIYFNVFNLTDGLGTPQTLDSCQSDSRPLITFDEKTNDFYVSWFESQIKYQKWSYQTETFSETINGTDTIADFGSNGAVQSGRYNTFNDLFWVYGASDLHLSLIHI